MNENEARELATRIIDTWPSGARAYIWRDTLLALDHHCADVTYRMLRASATNPPTPGAFMISYRQQWARLHEPSTEPEATADVISLAEYLRRVQRREDNEELEIWSRHLHPTAIEQEPF